MNQRSQIDTDAANRLVYHEAAETGQELHEVAVDLTWPVPDEAALVENLQRAKAAVERYERFVFANVDPEVVRKVLGKPRKGGLSHGARRKS